MSAKKPTTPRVFHAPPIQGCAVDFSNLRLDKLFPAGKKVEFFVHDEMLVLDVEDYLASNVMLANLRKDLGFPTDISVDMDPSSIEPFEPISDADMKVLLSVVDKDLE